MDCNHVSLVIVGIALVLYFISSLIESYRWVDSDDGRIPASCLNIQNFVWIDTDSAVGIQDHDVDDGLALIQALHSTEVNILGISTVFANNPRIPISESTRVAKHIVDSIITQKYNIPVYEGASNAISEGINKDNIAIENMYNILSKCSNVTIIALGPLTNIALLITMYPNITRHISGIIAVAGRRLNQKFTIGFKNPKGHKDVNFELDVQAMQTILDSTDIFITLTPFELSSKIWVNESDIQSFYTGSPVMQWIAPITDQWLQLWKHLFEVDGFNPFDTLAVAYSYTPQSFTCEQMSASIITLENEDPEPKFHFTENTSHKQYLIVNNDTTTEKRVNYCYDISPEFKEHLLSKLV
eukprot:gene7404-15123_t